MFLWAFYAAGTITLLPVWEGRDTLKSFVVFMFGKGRDVEVEVTTGIEPDSTSGSSAIEGVLVLEKGSESKKS